MLKMTTTWIECHLGDVVTLQRGFDLPNRDRREGKVPIVSSSGVSGYHEIPKVKGPGVVTGRYGTLGEVFFVREDFWPLNTTLYVRDFKGNDPLFISLFLKTLDLAHHNAAGAVPGVNRNALHLLPVKIPPLATQRRIAAVLSAYDDLIENNQRRIAILEEMARNLYREWFVEFRFPGWEQAQFVETALGRVPEGWKTGRLADVASVNKLSVKRGKEPSQIQYVDIASVSSGKIDKIETVPFTDAPGRARRIVCHGDIIWSTVRPNRRSYSLILHPISNLIVSTGFAVLTPRSVPYSYLYLAITTNEFVSYLTNRAKGSAYPAVTGKDFEEAELVISSVPILDIFHHITEDVLALQQTLQSRNANLRRQRDLLLPRLVSGELDVSELELAGVLSAVESE